MSQPKTEVRQIRENARGDEASVHGILDAGLVAHVGFVDDGHPYVIPMLYARDGRRLYLHGARKARIVQLLASGSRVCANVTLLDGVVAARSAFNSSLNYRSVTVFGTPRLLEDADARLHALRVLSEAVFPGRWDELRDPSPTELGQTGVIELPIELASAKVAEGPPTDDEADYAIPVWAGVVPIATSLGEPEDDGRLLPGVELSPAIAALVGRRL
jgi:nitroimidazol reductase NimA-like FMN-containing flavoprotein (pyridoxamine 5'-phosphate oxidase superfamily)